MFANFAHIFVELQMENSILQEQYQPSNAESRITNTQDTFKLLNPG